MRWWPGRRAADAAAAPEVPVARRAAWRDAAPLQRVLRPLSPVTSLQTFASSLGAWQDPRFVGPLGHVVDPDGPSGRVTGLATVQRQQPTYASAQDLDVAPARPARASRRCDHGAATDRRQRRRGNQRPARQPGRPGRRAVLSSGREQLSARRPPRGRRPSECADGSGGLEPARAIGTTPCLARRIDPSLPDLTAAGPVSHPSTERPVASEPLGPPLAGSAGDSVTEPVARAFPGEQTADVAPEVADLVSGTIDEPADAPAPPSGPPGRDAGSAASIPTATGAPTPVVSRSLAPDLGGAGPPPVAAAVDAAGSGRSRGTSGDHVVPVAGSLQQPDGAPSTRAPLTVQRASADPPTAAAGVVPAAVPSPPPPAARRPGLGPPLGARTVPPTVADTPPPGRPPARPALGRWLTRRRGTRPSRRLRRQPVSDPTGRQRPVVAHR